MQDDEKSHEPDDEKTESRTSYKTINFKVPEQELAKIREEYGINNDVTASIIYYAEKRKRPDVIDAIRKLSKKSKSSSSNPTDKGIYVPEGVEEVIRTTGEVTGEMLKEHLLDREEKAKKWEQQMEQLATKPTNEPDPVKDITSDYIKHALETDKQIKQKALEKLLSEPKDDPIKKIESTIEQKLSSLAKPEQKPTDLDSQLLQTLKQEMISEISKKIKGDSLKLTPELVGQIINGVSNIVDRFQPLLDANKIKTTTDSIRTRLSTIADLHRVMQENNLRAIKDIVFFLKDNSELISNPIIKEIVSSILAGNTLISRLMEAEIREVSSTPSPNDSKTQKVNLNEIG